MKDSFAKECAFPVPPLEPPLLEPLPPLDPPLELPEPPPLELPEPVPPHGPHTPPTQELPGQQSALLLHVPHDGTQLPL